MDEPLLNVRGLYKSFGAVQALTDVNLDLPAGQVTALSGDNGAGKSVLIKCISGIYEPDRGPASSGRDEPVRIRSAHDSAALGIETVYQDLALADNLDIVQNMFLGRERLRHGLLDEDDMERAAAETLASLGVTTVRSIRQPVGSLSGGQRQSVAVAKAVMWNSKLVIMDEPTAALGVTQTAMVLDLVRRLRDQRPGGDDDLAQPQRRLRRCRPHRRAVSGQDGDRGPDIDFDRQSVVEYMTTGGLGADRQRPRRRAGAVDHGHRLTPASRSPPTRRRRRDTASPLDT